MQTFDGPYFSTPDPNTISKKSVSKLFIHTLPKRYVRDKIRDPLSGLTSSLSVSTVRSCPVYPPQHLRSSFDRFRHICVTISPSCESFCFVLHPYPPVGTHTPLKEVVHPLLLYFETSSPPDSGPYRPVSINGYFFLIV